MPSYLHRYSSFNLSILKRVVLSIRFDSPQTLAVWQQELSFKILNSTYNVFMCPIKLSIICKAFSFKQFLEQCSQVVVVRSLKEIQSSYISKICRKLLYQNIKKTDVTSNLHKQPL